MKSMLIALLLLEICLLGTCEVSIAEGLFETRNVFVVGQDKIREYRIPALVTTGKGTLIAVCDARVEKPADAINNIDLAMKRSFDNGKTWEPLKILADFEGEQAAADPCMLVDRTTGTVWIAYDYVLDKLLPSDLHKRERRAIALHLISSRDDGGTWSKATDITGTPSQGQVGRPSWPPQAAASKRVRAPPDHSCLYASNRPGLLAPVVEQRSRQDVADQSARRPDGQ